MKNNYGFGKFEVLTVIVLLLAVSAFLSYTILKGTPAHKLQAMKDSSTSFTKAVTVNNDTFHNTENVYLQEVIDEGLISEIKNPVGSGKCSSTDSLVQIIDGKPYVTLHCGEYLIEKANFAGSGDIPLYKVSDWSLEKKGDNIEERTLYNCEVSGKEVFDHYYDELYFVYEINKKYGTDYYYESAVESTCKVVRKTFYRTKELVE